MAKTYCVGIVGVGTMGSGIAQKMAQEGIKVTLLDIDEEKVKKGIDGIKKMLDQGVEKNVFTREKADATLNRIKGTPSYEDLKDMDLVIEAVFEDQQLKGNVFRKLDEVCNPRTIFASNTSSLSISELSKNTNRRDKFIGTHYFFHPAKNRLLEIIPHESTSKETLEKVLFIGKIQGKTMIVAKDTPGFIVNRFFIPYYVQAIRALEEGVANIPTIERAAKGAFGIGMGPFELINVSGMGVSANAPKALKEKRGNFYAPPKILQDKAEAGELWDLKGEVEEDKIKEVQELLYGAVFGVVCTMVDEGTAEVEQIDRGAKVGLRWGKGPFEKINEIGIDKAYEYVKKVKERYPNLDFEIPKILEDHYKSKEPFKFSFVSTTIKDDIANIEINRPEAMNALNDEIFTQLIEEFDKAEKNKEVKTVVIKSTGKEFIAGADIKYFVRNIQNDNLDKTLEFTKKSNNLLRRFETSPKLTIALVDGLALGGGAELALACQAIVATHEASFAFPETGIGIFPGNGGMVRLAKHLGPELAKYFVFTGKKLNAEEAKEIGIVTKLVDITEVNRAIKEIIKKGKFDKFADRKLPDKYKKIRMVFSKENVSKLLNGEIPEGVDREFAEKIVSILSNKAPIALKMANEIIDKQIKVSIDKAIEIEISHNVEIFKTKDALLGLTNIGKRVQFQSK